MDTALKHKPGRVIIDFSNAHRCETCIGQLIKRKALEYTSESRPQPLVFSGTLPSNSLSLDLARGGVSCYWPQFAWTDTKDGHISCYPRLSDAVHVLQPSRKICHDDSDSSVLGEVDYLFGNLARGRSIGETLHRGGASIYRVKSGGTIPQQGMSPSAVLLEADHQRRVLYSCRAWDFQSPSTQPFSC